jgi:hypothetical protein
MCEHNPRHLLLRVEIEHKFMVKPDAPVRDLKTYPRQYMQIFFYGVSPRMLWRQLGSMVQRPVTCESVRDFVERDLQKRASITRANAGRCRVKKLPVIDLFGLNQDDMPADLSRQRH